MTKTETIVAEIRRRVEEGLLPPGAKLASIRRAAEEFGVSKNTAVEAYDRLVSLGLIAARPGAGFSVVSSARPVRGDEAPPHLVEAVDSVSLLRAQLDQNYQLRVGDGRPPAAWMDGILPKRALGASGEATADSSGYGSPKGYRGLRELIAARFRARDIALDAERVVTTFGANHALDMIIRRYLSPGDTVLVDDPGYYPLFAKLKFAQVRQVGVRRGPQGPDLDDLRACAERERPAFFFTQSHAQNPTGGSIDLAHAHGVLQIAETHGFRVVDDDPFVDLPGARGVPLAALDQLRNVIFVGSFSKTVSASFRSGYIAAASDIVDELAELKMITAVNSSRFSELMIADMMTSRRYDKHLKRLGQRIEAASADLAAVFARLGLATHSPPGHGYYTYLELPERENDLEIAQRAARESIFLAPGPFFAAGPARHRPGLRINIARAGDPRFVAFLKRLAAGF